MRKENSELEAIRSVRLSPTEQRHPGSMNLDKLPLKRAIKLMLREEQKVPGSLLKEIRGIERVIGAIVRALRRGGRLFYVGAGSSGRLGVLDASECPSTFRARPDMVQAIIAGGARALTSAIEGAEDDAAAGAKAIRSHRISYRDIVVG